MKPINCQYVGCPYNRKEKCGIPDDNSVWTIKWLATVVNECKDELALPTLSNILLSELDLIIAFEMRKEARDEMHLHELRAEALRDYGNIVLTNGKDIIETLSN